MMMKVKVTIRMKVKVKVLIEDKHKGESADQCLKNTVLRRIFCDDQ